MAEREVWYFLVDKAGQLVEGTSADAVDLSSSSSIRRFRDAVKEKCDRQGDDLKGILASKLLIYANKATFDRKDDPLLPENDIGNYGTKESKLYVIVPASAQQHAESEEKLAISLYKRKRWDSINEMIQKHKKSKIAKQGKRKGEISIPYSDVEWEDLEPLFRSFLKPFNLQPFVIPQTEVDALYSCLQRITGVFGGVFTGKEAKRLFFIAPVLTYVSYLFKGDVRLLVEETVDGRQVQTNGYFEFVICRGDKRVGIVEAKKDDMEQGMAQNLLGCEALSDVEQLPIVYGIVTNYTQWIFFRSETDCIYQHDATIDLGESDMPTKKSLRKIAGMIYSLLA
jgi:hypothetical protein